MITEITGGKIMNRIDVVPTEDGKFKVLHNFIQHGIEHKSKQLAEHEAETIRARFYPTASKAE